MECVGFRSRLNADTEARFSSPTPLVGSFQPHAVISPKPANTHISNSDMSTQVSGREPSRIFCQTSKMLSVKLPLASLPSDWSCLVGLVCLATASKPCEIKPSNSRLSLFAFVHSDCLTPPKKYCTVG